MRNGVFTVVEGGVVMLLADLEGCRIGECGGVGGGVEMPYAVIVGRGRRENVVGFGREATSAHDIGFLGVVGEEAGEEVGEVGGESGAGGVSGVGGAGFFVCFVRTWS